MSFKAFVWAWDQDIPNPDYQHILLGIANIAPSRETYASVPYIARMCRRSPRRVRAALAWLEEARIVTLTERPGRTDLIRMNIPAEFSVLMPDEDDDLEFGPRGRPKKTPALAKTPAPETVKPLANPSPRGADEPIEPEEPKDIVLRAPEPFEVWWEAYPRKIAKVAARKAWRSVPAKIGMDDLMELTRRFADHVVGKDPEHVPHPATWLNGERWNDELTPKGGQTDGNRRAAGPDNSADRFERGIRNALAGAAEAVDRRGRERWRL